MSTGTLAAGIMVPFFGAMLCLAPAATRPTAPRGWQWVTEPL